MSYGFGRTIGSDPHNKVRMNGLRKIQAGGYRGKVSVTAYFGADMYTISDDNIEYNGYRHHSDKEYMPVNYSLLLAKTNEEQ